MKIYKFQLRFHWLSVSNGPIDNITALLQILAWRRPGHKPSSEPMLVSLLTHICITRPQWVQCPTLNKELLYRKYMRFINQLYILLYIVFKSVCTSSKQNSYIFRHMNITSTSHGCLKLPVTQLDCLFNRLLRQISLREGNPSVTDGFPSQKASTTAPVPGPLWGKSIGDRWFPVTKGQ